jgi:hypothetical protein
MSAAEFEAVRPLLRISEARMEAARLALVEGRTLQVAAGQFGWSRQAVNDAVRVVWKAFQKYCESQLAAVNAGARPLPGLEPIPPGWERVTLIAPAHLVVKFRREVALAEKKVRRGNAQ